MTTLRAGSLADWNPTTAQNSLAKEIATELETILPPPPGDPVPRRKLCIAIARGVLKYLRDNDAAITVSTPSGTANTTRHASVSVDLSA